MAEDPIQGVPLQPQGHIYPWAEQPEHKGGAHPAALPVVRPAQALPPDGGTQPQAEPHPGDRRISPQNQHPRQPQPGKGLLPPDGLRRRDLDRDSFFRRGNGRDKVRARSVRLNRRKSYLRRRARHGLGDGGYLPLHRRSAPAQKAQGGGGQPHRQRHPHQHHQPQNHAQPRRQAQPLGPPPQGQHDSGYHCGHQAHVQDTQGQLSHDAPRFRQ